MSFQRVCDVMFVSLFVHLHMCHTVTSCSLHFACSLHAYLCVMSICVYVCEFIMYAASVGYMHVVHLLQATPRTMLARPSTLWRAPLSGWSVQCVRH